MPIFAACWRMLFTFDRLIESLGQTVYHAVKQIMVELDSFAKLQYAYSLDYTKKTHQKRILILLGEIEGIGTVSRVHLEGT